MDEFNESVVNAEDSVQDDAVQDSQETSQETGIQAISDFLGEQPEGGETTPQDGAQEEKVSGGIKGRLLAENKKGYERGKQEAEAAWQQEKAQYEARIQKLQELEIKEKATELAAKEKISLGLAERIIRAEAGLPKPPEQQEMQQQAQPRDAQGRFVSRETDWNAYAQTLLEQAKHIKDLTGLDVMDVYNKDDDVKRRVSSKEIDFYGIAQELQQKQTRRMPPVVRSSNGQTGRAHGIASLSDEQLDKLDAELERGVVYDMRR